MWTNLNLLFWLSLVPFSTKWMDETHFSTFTVVAHASLLLLCGLSYSFLSRAIYKSLNEDDRLKNVFKFSSKDLFSIGAYALSIITAFIDTRISLLLFLFVALIWIIPSKTIENELLREKMKELVRAGMIH